MFSQKPQRPLRVKIISKQARKLSKIKEVRKLSLTKSSSIKGWRERIVPGFVMQTLGGTKVWLQVSPQVYYKINSSWSAGVGGMYRFSMNPDRLTFHDFKNLYGGNVFIQSHFFKGFFLRAEGQHLTWQPWNVKSKDPDYREKTTVAAIGIGKSYFIAKKVKANVQTLYHVNWAGADPYASKILIRFGFDFSLTKKEVKPGKRN